MADEKAPAKEDIFALEKPNGLKAYPKMVYIPDPDVDTNLYPNGKYRNGESVMKELGIVKNPEEHKKLLAENKQAAWPGAKSEK